MAQLKETKKKGSFRRNVIVTLIVISLISLGATGAVSLGFVNIIGGYTTDQSADALQTQIERNMELTAEQNGIVIKQKLDSAEAMVNHMAEECEYLFREDSTFAPRDYYYDYFFRDQSAGPHPDDIVFEERYGIDVSWNYSSWYIAGSNSTNYQQYEDANKERLDRVSNLDHTFLAVHQQLSEFRWLYVVFASNGLFINYPGSDVGQADNDRNTAPFTPTLEDWYLDIVDGGGDIVFVDPYYDPIDNVLLISIGKAVYFQNGTLIGIIAGDITVDNIRDKILDVQVLESGYAALLTAGGRVVAHPDAEDSDYAFYTPELPRLGDYEINTNPLSPALGSAQMIQITSGQTGVIDYQKDGEGYLLTYTPIDKAGYIVIIIVPISEVQAAIPALEARIGVANQQATTFILAITLGGIVLAGVVAYAVAGSVTRPLEYLMDLAMRNASAMIKEEELDSVDLQVDTSYTSQDDEIGELARAFQGMLDTIREDEEE